MAREMRDDGLDRIPGNDQDAFDHWMAQFSDLDDAVLDRALRGEVPTGHEDLAPIAEMASTLRTVATLHAPEMGSALRSQIRTQPRVPARHAGAAGRRLRLGVTAAAVALVALGVAASQNALPAAAQRMIADAAEVVGVSVPRPPEDDPSPPAPAPEGADPSSGSTPSTEGTDASDPAAPPVDRTDAADNDDTDASTSGPPDETPGGATPADPGIPGDGEPATPATPPDHSSGGGNGNPNGNNAGGNGNGNNAGGNGNGNNAGGNGNGNNAGGNGNGNNAGGNGNGNNAGGNGNGNANGLDAAPGQSRP